MDRRIFLRNAAAIGLSLQSTQGDTTVLREISAIATEGQGLQPTIAAAIARARNGRLRTSFPTGLTDLDWLMREVQPGALIAVASRPSLGKTTFVLNIARHLALIERRPVLFFSPGESALRTTQRLLSAVARVDMSKLTCGALSDPVEWQRVSTAAVVLDNGPLLIDDRALPEVLDIKARALMHAAEWRRPLGAIVVDNPELMGEFCRSGDPESRMAEVMQGLKDAAREFNAPVLVTTGVGRRPECRRDKRPRITDLSGPFAAIAKIADTFLFLYRDEVYDPDSPDQDYAEVTLARNGLGSVGSTVSLAFHPEYALFEDDLRWR